MNPKDRSRSSSEDIQPAEPRGAAIRGRVIGSDGAPAAGAFVSLQGEGVPDISEQTGPDGSYSLGGTLAPGTYTIYAQHGSRTGRTSIAVGSSGDHDADDIVTEGEER